MFFEIEKAEVLADFCISNNISTCHVIMQSFHLPWKVEPIRESVILLIHEHVGLLFLKEIP